MLGLSTRAVGQAGGLKLGRDPSTVTLVDIITCFDGHTLFTDCCLGLPGCGESKHKCPVHDQWGAVRQQIKEWWTNTTLADFSAQDTGRLPKRTRAVPKRLGGGQDPAHCAAGGAEGGDFAPPRVARGCWSPPVKAWLCLCCRPGLT